MTVRHIPVSLLVALFLVALGACRTPRGPYSPITRADGKKPIQLREGVIMMDMEVRNALRFINKTAKRLPTDMVKARVQMQNMYRDETLWADVRFVFYDVDEMAVEQSAWQKVAFPPHELVMIQSNSLRKDTATYNIQFRNLQSSSGRQLAPSGRVLEHGLWRQSVLPE